nr:hypothetical protein [Tanacetum cinerariifolium]
MDIFNLINALDPSKVETSLRPCTAHEVPLLTATASRVIDMEDPNMETESSGTPSTIEKSPLDFDNENPSPPMTEGKGTEDKPMRQWHLKSPPKKYACHRSCIKSKPRGGGCCYETLFEQKNTIEG